MGGPVANARPDSYNVECADPSDTSGECHPYANIMDIPTGEEGKKWRMSCDEFPFGKSAPASSPRCIPVDSYLETWGTYKHSHSAKSAQGGSGTAICIPAWQNFFQGYKLRMLEKVVGDGNDYIIEITGWDCKAGQPLPRAVKNCGRKTGTRVKRDEDVGRDSLSQGMSPAHGANRDITG
jgi:hypothetical protein